MDVEVKICGLTRPEDAAFAAAHGAWRLGVIFAGGPRLVDVARAREIVAAAAGVPVLGVFGTAGRRVDPQDSAWCRACRGAAARRLRHRPGAPARRGRAGGVAGAGARRRQRGPRCRRPNARGPPTRCSSKRRVPVAPADEGFRCRSNWRDRPAPRWRFRYASCLPVGSRPTPSGGPSQSSGRTRSM